MSPDRDISEVIYFLEKPYQTTQRQVIKELDLSSQLCNSLNAWT